MNTNPDPLRNLINELSRLPGIGEKTAARLAFFILASESDYALRLSRAIGDLKTRIRICTECFQFTESDPCTICKDEKRDHKTLCVVEQPSNLLALERTGEYRGIYHVLHGALSPLNGVGPEQIRARELVLRLERLKDVKEVILATNPNTEGEATALYLSKLIAPTGIAMSKIASGIPVGGDLEYTDHVTLCRALAARQRL